VTCDRQKGGQTSSGSLVRDNANTSSAAAVAGDSDDSDVVAGDASYVSSSLLLLSVVNHNASV